MELDSPAAAEGLAVRLAAITRREELHTLLQSDDWASATATAGEKQQQGSHPSSRAAVGSSGASGSLVDRSDLMARLAVLQGRNTDGATDTTGSQSAAADAQIPPPAAAEAATSSMLERLQVLRQRQAAQQQQQVIGGIHDCCMGSGVQDDLLQRPEDFVHCMRSLLTTCNFPTPLMGHDDEGDAAAAGVMPDQQTSSMYVVQQPDAGCGSPMCLSPHRCGKQHDATKIPIEPTAQLLQQQEQVIGVPDTRQQQQQQRNHPALQRQGEDETAAFEPLIPGHVRRLLVLAAQSLSAEEYTQARARAAAAQQAAAAIDCAGANSSSSSAISSFCREAEKLQAMAVILEHVPQHQWFAALQLSGPSGSCHQSAAAAAAAAADSSVKVQHVQRAYRRVAGLVHPDKCKHPCAEAAFKALTRAHQHALAALGAEGQHPLAGVSADDVSTGVDGGVGEYPRDGADNDYTWWSEWERDVSAGHVDGAAAAGGGGGGVSSSVPSQADDEEELWGVSMQELVAEVERRQVSVLRPLSPTDQARQPAERQKRLRVARTVLSARMQQHRQAAVAAVAGDDGDDNHEFMYSDTHSAGGGFVADASDWTGHKRQRL